MTVEPAIVEDGRGQSLWLEVLESVGHRDGLVGVLSAPRGVAGR